MLSSGGYNVESMVATIKSDEADPVMSDGNRM